jgi:hypothetical protein
VLAVVFFFGIAVWRLESHHRQNKRPVRQGARLPQPAGSRMSAWRRRKAGDV